ncbi:MAG: hypothetical protein IKR25_02430 [Muribaculaceae bacterium]|nr:hypothetical protein [Muribaculaceae bacterium]
MKHICGSLVWVLCLLAVSFHTLGQGNKYTYDAREWLTVNAQSLQQLRLGGGDMVAFKPCAIDNDFVAAKCKVVEYYGCAVYFDMERRTAIFVDDEARADYFVIFANVVNVNMGAAQNELYIECSMTHDEAFDVIYNVRTHQARKVADGDATLMRRFARRLPHVFYKDPHDKNTRLLHDYFKALAAGQYVEAQKVRHKIIVKALDEDDDEGNRDIVPWNNQLIFNAYPLMELGEALIMSYPAKYKERDEMQVPRDLFRGYQYVKQVYRRDTLLSEANTVLLSGDIRLSVDLIKKNLEEELLSYARWEGTEEAYDRVLTTFYNSPLRKQARDEQEKLVYTRVATTTNQNELLAYLNKFSGVDEGHYNFVEQRYFQLAYEAMPATAEGCRQYLKQCALSPHADEVRTRLAEYAFNELQPTEAACKEFLTAFPRSKHCTEVWYRLYEYAYNELGDDLSKCQRYLKEYPNSKYCEDVQRKIIDIKYAQAVRVGSVEAYDAFLKGTSWNSHTEDIEQRRAALLGQPFDMPSTHQGSIENFDPTVTAQPQLGTAKPKTAETKKQQKPAEMKPTPKPKPENNNSTNSSNGELWELDF